MSLTVNQKLRINHTINAFAPVTHRQGFRTTNNPVHRPFLINTLRETACHLGIPGRGDDASYPTEQAREQSCTAHQQAIVFFQRKGLYRAHRCRPIFMPGRLPAASTFPGASGGDEK
jgi:hypothetical protein